MSRVPQFLSFFFSFSIFANSKPSFTLGSLPGNGFSGGAVVSE
jgi:hypothetical protein